MTFTLVERFLKKTKTTLKKRKTTSFETSTAFTKTNSSGR